MIPVPTWHIVTSQGALVLGVFGEALLSEAQVLRAQGRSANGVPRSRRASPGRIEILYGGGIA
jgi:hypothetical protein